jgi:hypothetical protein
MLFSFPRVQILKVTARGARALIGLLATPFRKIRRLLREWWVPCRGGPVKITLSISYVGSALEIAVSFKPHPNEQENGNRCNQNPGFLQASARYAWCVCLKASRPIWMPQPWNFLPVFQAASFNQEKKTAKHAGKALSGISGRG